MSGIEWTDETWNPLAGCTPVSSGCLTCYAATMANRLHAMTLAGRTVPGYEQPLTETKNGRQVFNGTVRMIEGKLTEPLKWQRGHARWFKKHGRSRRVFVNSMSDLFHESVPDEFIDRVFAVMALCPDVVFQICTKRPERMEKYLNNNAGPFSSGFVLNRWYMAAQDFMDIDSFPEHRDWDWSMPDPAPLPNVWLGTSVEDQAAADERIPHLLRCPAAVRFLSCEPLLGAVDLGSAVSTVDAQRLGVADDPLAAALMNAGVESGNGDGQRWIDWVIVGGESGPKARPCDVAWIRSIVSQCKGAGVPVFVKQLGAMPVESGRAAAAMPDAAWAWDDSGEQIERWYRLKDRKGGDPAEWPEDLRVREMPRVAGGCGVGAGERAER